MREHDALEHNPHVSKRALEALHSQLFGWAFSRCGYDRAAAEDLMQQAYVEILSGRARFDKRSSLKTFLFGIVQNLAKSRFRRLSNRLRLIDGYAAEPTVVPAGGERADADERQRIWQAVEQLPARQRDITELVFCRDLTIGEAATVMGVSLGTGRVHYDRAKKALAAALGELRLQDIDT